MVHTSGRSVVGAETTEAAGLLGLVLLAEAAETTPERHCCGVEKCCLDLGETTRNVKDEVDGVKR